MQHARGDHHRHDGQPVKPVGEIDRIGRADDDDHREGNEEKAEVDQHVLEDRQRQLELQIRRVVPAGPARRDQRDEKAKRL